MRIRPLVTPAGLHHCRDVVESWSGDGASQINCTFGVMGRVGIMASETLNSEKLRIVFREAKRDGIATFWYVEVYSPEGTMFPVGTAYVVQAAKVASLSFIFVADCWRRQGYGRAMIEAIRNRWPDFQASSPIDSDVAMKFAIATQSLTIEDEQGEMVGESNESIIR